MNQNKPLRLAVIGVGAFGRNHARVYHELQQDPSNGVELVAVVDGNESRGRAISQEFRTQFFVTVEQLLESTQIDAVSVAVPTVHHLDVARKLMTNGVDVLVEKPLAPSLADADEMIRIAEANGRIAQVGQLERFNPAVRATLPLVTAPMFFEAHRLSVFTPRSLDVDVVLDLMIHDLDIVLSLVKSPVREIRAVGLPVLTPKVDIASVRVEFESGCIANFTASRVSTERVRKLRFFQPYQYVSLDFARRDVFQLSVQPTAESAPSSILDMAGSYEGMPQISPFKPTVDSEEPLRAELRSFLHSVRTRQAPEVALSDGRNALALALAIAEQMEEHRERAKIDSLMAKFLPETRKP